FDATKDRRAGGVQQPGARPSGHGRLGDEGRFVEDDGQVVRLLEDVDVRPAAVVIHLEGELAIPDPHPADLDAARLPERNRVEVDAAGGGVGHDAERGLHQVEGRARAPRLRVAGYEVLGRTVVVMAVAPEPAEQLRQAMVGHADAGLHDAFDYAAGRLRMAVATQTGDRDRVVVGPDRAVVITHRVVVR